MTDSIEKFKESRVEKEIDLSVFYMRGTSYEITLNPKKQHPRQKHRLKLIYKELMEVVESLSLVADVTLYPEISEPRYGNSEGRGQEPRVHFHGTLKLKDTETSVGLFLLNKLKMIKDYSDFCINKDRGEGWYLYCTKQKSIMKPLCKLYKEPYIIKGEVSNC